MDFGTGLDKEEYTELLNELGAVETETAGQIGWEAAKTNKVDEFSLISRTYSKFRSDKIEMVIDNNDKFRKFMQTNDWCAVYGEDDSGSVVRTVYDIYRMLIMI